MMSRQRLVSKQKMVKQQKIYIINILAINIKLFVYISKYELKNVDLTQKMFFIHIQKKHSDVDNRFFNFEISINNLPDIKDKVNMFKYDYESRTRPNMTTTKKVVSILNEIINSKRYFYLLHKSILNLTEKYHPQTLYKV